MPSTGQYTIIATENQLKKYLDGLREKNITKIALDMEGDQGMFHYRYAISILQCFDGREAAIIDVLGMGANDTLREFLTCRDITKVMFSCGNDIYMAQNVLCCTIAPVADIAIAQKLLDLPINLTAYLGIDKKEKDAFQRANWLLRPIRPALLEYAVNDVLKLLDIEENLAKELVDRGLYDNYLESTKAASLKNYFIQNTHTLYTDKFPGYKRLPFEKKRLAAALWIFRELLGEKYDRPVGYLLPRKSLTAIINKCDGDLAKAIEKEINLGRSESKKLGVDMIRKYVDKAMESPHIPEKPAIKRRSLR